MSNEEKYLQGLAIYQQNTYILLPGSNGHQCKQIQQAQQQL